MRLTDGDVGGQIVRMSVRHLVATPILLAAVASSAGGQARDWMFGPFEKPAVNPIITPNSSSTFLSPMTDSVVKWEELATFNPAAVARQGKA